MTQRYYFDTSIWLDLFENRDEEHLLKGKHVWALMKKILAEDSLIIYSDIIVEELHDFGYPPYKIEALFQPFQRILLFVYANENQKWKANDLCKKRNIPPYDALHALIARENNAIMVTRDHDFQLLLDIIIPKRPEELTSN